MSFSDLVIPTHNMTASETVTFLSAKLAHLHIPFEDIVSATDNFAGDNCIDRGSIADVYKGKLLRSEHWIHVAIRRFLPSSGLLEIEFLRETATLSRLNHKNTLSIFGYCNENGEMMIVFEYQDNGSLDKYLSHPNLLTWSQRLKIFLGVARALRCIHNEIKRSLCHGFHLDIKPSKILLDKDWEAKLFCFGFYIGHDVVFSSTSSYTDPTVPRNWWTHMSNVYSFGVILFEVLCGGKAEMGGGDESLVPMAVCLYEDGKLDDIIHPDLRKQMYAESLSIFSEIAYDCVKKRFSIDRIVETLQTALELPLKHENLVREYSGLYLICIYS